MFSIACVGYWLWDCARGNIGLLSIGLGGVWIFALRRQLPRWAAWAPLCVCPVIALPSYAAAKTAVDFGLGVARRSSAAFGYPSPSALNLDPERRVFPHPGGCFADGVDAVLLARIERGTFDMLFGLFGPMPGAYQGPYPSREQAERAVLRDSVPVSDSDWRLGAFNVGQRRVRLTQKARSRVPLPRGNGQLAASVFQGTVLLVKADLPGVRAISAFDLNGFGWFATYRYAL